MKSNMSLDCFGKLKFINTSKGFGFIEMGNHPDVFFSTRCIKASNLNVGDELCFNLSQSRREAGKFEAISVRNVYKSADGFRVFNRPNSHLHEGITSMLGEIISRVKCGDRDFLQEEVCFDSAIGKNILVSVADDDDIVYAVRKGRSGHTKFVRNREPEDCRTAVVILKRVEAGYVIITSFIGNLTVPEPWDKHAKEESFDFWSSHALIYGHEQVLEDSVTPNCPWNERIIA